MNLIGNICVDNYYLSNNNKKIGDFDNYKCIQNCDNYIYNNLCTNNCNNFNLNNYIIKSNDGDKKVCIEKCPNNFHIQDTNICVKTCNGEKPYLNLKDNKYVEDCNSIQGFILESNENNGIKICYKSYPSNTYYEINNNKCIELSHLSENCFFHEDNFQICYNGCCGEYKYEYNNTCYKNFICGEQYYYNISGIIKCIPMGKYPPAFQVDIYVRICIQEGYNYLRGRECVRECDLETEYIIEGPSNFSPYHGYMKLGLYCFDPDCDTKNKFYSSNKVLLENCPNGYKIIEGAETKSLRGSNGTCVEECPSDYPYLSEDGKSCNSSCPNFYINDTTKKCVSQCKEEDIYSYHFNGKKECIKNCSKKVGSD